MYESGIIGFLLLETRNEAIPVRAERSRAVGGVEILVFTPRAGLRLRPRLAQGTLRPNGLYS